MSRQCVARLLLTKLHEAKTIAVMEITVPTMPSESANADMMFFLICAKHHLPS